MDEIGMKFYQFDLYARQLSSPWNCVIFIIWVFMTIEMVRKKVKSYILVNFSNSTNTRVDLYASIYITLTYWFLLFCVIQIRECSDCSQQLNFFFLDIAKLTNLKFIDSFPLSPRFNWVRDSVRCAFIPKDKALL